MGEEIERHVTFHVLPEAVQEFRKFFEQEYRPMMTTIEGYIKADLLIDTENPQDFKMVLRFESVDAAADWRASEMHVALKPRLKSMYSDSELKVYEVIT
jgi:antibiotic biosynthesis monooxygenase (ABM) superfamily enzyme